MLRFVTGDDEDAPEFASWIREQRRRLTLTQEDLADRAGVSIRTIRNLEAGRGGRPTPHTRRAVRAVLAPSLGEASAGSRTVPAQLPADVAVFVGRDAELGHLTDLVCSEKPASALLVCGPAGVGKTALAVRLAHRLRGSFTDGQIFVDLRGYDPDRPMRAEEALVGLLQALGVPPQAIPLDPGARAAAYRTALAGRRMIVVLDNAATADQVRLLLPGSPVCVTVITSRDPLSGLVAREGATRLRLAPLDATRSVELLTGLIGPHTGRDHSAALAIADRCAGLPLVLRVAAELVNNRPGASLAAVLDDLTDDGRRLEVLSDPTDSRTAVREVFSWSLRHLTDADQHAFALLGSCTIARFDPYLLAAMTATDPRTARAALSALSNAGLVQPSDIGAWTFHDLLHAYARELPVPDGERRAATDRGVAFLLVTVAACADILYPADRALRPAPPASDATLPPVADRERALAWLADSRQAILDAAAAAAADGRPGDVILFAQLMFRHLDTGGHYVDAVHVHSLARSAALSLGDRAAEASALIGLGAAHFRQAGYEVARALLEEANALARTVPDDLQAGRALNLIGAIHFQQGEPDRAIAVLEETQMLFQRAGYQLGEANALANLGIARWRSNEYPLAADLQRRAAGVFARIGHDAGVVLARLNLGAACWRQGDYPAARAELTTARALARRVGDRDGEAHALMNLAITERRQGDLAAAEGHGAEALAMFESVRDRAGEAELVNETGALRTAQGRPVEAIAAHRRAVGLFREIGDAAGEAGAQNGLGAAFRAAGDVDRADACHREARSVATQIHDRYELARASDGLALGSDLRGDAAAARRHWVEAVDLLAGMVVPELADIRRRLATLG